MYVNVKNKLTTDAFTNKKERDKKSGCINDSMVSLQSRDQETT